MSRELVLVQRSTPLALLPEDLLSKWAADMRLRNLSRNTILSYVSDLLHLTRFLARPLETATLADLRAFGHALLEQNASIATWARRATAFRTFFDWYRQREGRTVSVAQDLEVPRRARHVHRWWTNTEVRQFRRVFRKGEPARLLSGHTRRNEGYYLADPRIVVLRDRAICELGLMGLRVNEVTGLRLEDLINISIPTRAAIVVHRKGRKEQVLPLVRDARLALRRWLHIRPNVPTPILFIRLPFQRGRPARLHNGSVGRIVQAYALRAGLLLPPYKAFHHLRHTAGQQMAELGMGVEEAQAFLGHESPTTTMVYYQVSSQRLRRTARRFKY
jgi:integrase/recombinase XerC